MRTSFTRHGWHALAVPYKFGDKHLLMHPDFLFWHDDGDGEYVMDIVDPHRHDFADTSAKWAALAQYAQDHADRVRRCVPVVKIGGTLRALDLTADGISAKIAAVPTGSAAVDLDGRPGGRAGLAGGEVVDYRGAPGFADCPASRMI